MFANIVLGDEINRASPKTQSALLEAMEERQVTVDGTTYPLDPPFMVIATQNPVEHEGTYPLPESQLDRFLMRVSIGYPDRQAELEILDIHAGRHDASRASAPVATATEVPSRMVQAVRAIHVAPALKGYLVDLADATRRHPGVALGMSPRATLSMLRAARARAAAAGRNYVIPDDVKALAGPVLAHRLVLSPDAQLQGADAGAVVEDVLACGAGARRRGSRAHPPGLGAPRRARPSRSWPPGCSASSSCSSSARRSWSSPVVAVLYVRVVSRAARACAAR